MSVHLLLDSTLMPTQRWENHTLIAEFRCRRLTLRCLAHVTQAAWQAVIDMWQEASCRIAQTECTHTPELRVCRGNQCASIDESDRKRGGCAAILNCSPTAMACAQRNTKIKEKATKKDSVNISQRAALIASGALDEKERDNVCPRCNRELYAFQIAAGQIMRCRGWDLTGTPCTLTKASGYGVQCRQESTVQSFRLFSFATRVRDRSSSSCGPDQRRCLRTGSHLRPCCYGHKFRGVSSDS